MATSPGHRYLVSIDPKSALHRFADVLIIGGGLAGLRTSLAVDSQQSVIVVTKDKLRQSSSSYAQGGIAGAIDPQDRIEWHVRDTLVAGGTLCDEATVQMVVQQAPARIRELIAMGTRFDRQAEELTLGREGGHSHNRVVHALGDATGAEIMRAVIDQVYDLPNVEIIEDAFTLDLLTFDEQCRGAIVAIEGEKILIWAKQTILCTGGAGQLYRESTNPPVATADGHAMAFRAGAELRDMEFLQFHPTVLYIAGGSRSLITEAVRGEGAHLIDSAGYRFMPDYDERAELAPRDIVSQAIVNQMEKTKSPSVFLDLSHLDREYVLSRFPGISAVCREFGIDVTRDRIPVRPGAHYMIGGATVDLEGRTSLNGLWAAGEVTSSGLHGANRLASNSLLEGLVYGLSAGRGAAQAAASLPEQYLALPIRYQFRSDSARVFDLPDIRNSLKSLMWHAVGVRRDRQSLEAAAEAVETWQRYVLAQSFDSCDGWELQNMLTVAGLMIQAALCREESRGVHWRSDYPQSDDQHWRCHICFRANQQYLDPTPPNTMVDKRPHSVHNQ